jgi:hypothetical protein
MSPPITLLRLTVVAGKPRETPRCLVLLAPLLLSLPAPVIVVVIAVQDLNCRLLPVKTWGESLCFCSVASMICFCAIYGVRALVWLCYMPCSSVIDILVLLSAYLNSLALWSILAIGLGKQMQNGSRMLVHPFCYSKTL